ncbi:unnamed protein product [Blepharisma stoltei]|uniref:Peroxisomal membrane protein 11C n=1 Tax=Blepharisma stoltei TaxID=1481888 RepID=A0AAU9JN51_9CILI|nr:unnamed protein product [Blepharisma stoltei]
MRQTNSLKLLNNAVSPAKVLVSLTSSSISHVMRTTRGKEKLLALIQYSSELFKLTMKEYLEHAGKPDIPTHVRNAIEIEKSMRNGRKLMRVLMFVDEINSIEKVWQSSGKFDFFKIVRILNHFSSTIFYLLDNLVWCSDIGIINKYVTKATLQWRQTKDMACLAKCILQSTICVMTAFKARKKIISSQNILKENSDGVVKNGGIFVGIIEGLLMAKKEYRLSLLSVFVSFLRYLMLTKALNLPGASYMSRIFISLCGIFSMCLNIYCLLIGDSMIRTDTQQNSHRSKLNDLN